MLSALLRGWGCRLLCSWPPGPWRPPLGAAPPLPAPPPAAGMKCKAVLRKRCKDCFLVRRRGHVYVYCKTHPRHKQRKI